MNKQEQHYRLLTEQIRDQKIAPPEALQKRFESRSVKTTVVNMYWKRWAIAASLILAVGLTWVNFQNINDRMLTFPPDVVVENFNGSSTKIDPHYRVDRNFHLLRNSYKKLNF